MLLSEQTVLVTGAGRGLGNSIARAFAREGARVVVNYRSSRASAEALADTLNAGSSILRAVALHADVTSPEEVAALFAAAHAHFGHPITTVVNNALADFSFNGDARASADTIGWDAFAAQFEGTVRATLNTTQAALPAMRAAGFGRIITIGTNLFQNPVVPYHDYTAAKAAVLSLTRTLAADYGQHGVGRPSPHHRRERRHPRGRLRRHRRRHPARPRRHPRRVRRRRPLLREPALPLGHGPKPRRRRRPRQKLMSNHRRADLTR
jgi:3-oxoacyl-[acyl-carrier protein] reductase